MTDDHLESSPSIDRRRFLSKTVAAGAIALAVPNVTRADSPMNPTWSPTLGTNRASGNTSTINVRDYGAKGDGVTDDLVPIRTAYAAAEGKRLYFPSGTYKYSANLVFSSKVDVFGDGPKISDYPPLHPRAGAGGTILAPTAAVSIAVTHDSGQLHDLSIDGVSTTGATGVLVGTVTQAGHNLRRVRISRFSGRNAVGLEIRRSVSPTLFGINVDSCATNLIVTNVAADGTPTSMWFRDCAFRSSTIGPGVFFKGGMMAIFDGCIFESNKQEGLKIYGGKPPILDNNHSGRLHNCWFEGNWRGDPSNKNYHVSADGSTVAMGMHFDNVHFQCRLGAGPKAVHLTDMRETTLARIEIYGGGAVGSIVVDGAKSQVALLSPMYDENGLELQSAVTNGSRSRVTYPVNSIVGGAAPVSEIASGVPGTMLWDASYLYVCIAANTWKRFSPVAWA